MFARITRNTPVVAVLVLAILSGGLATAAEKKKPVPEKSPSTQPTGMASSSKLASAQEAGWSLTPGFTIKPSDVSVPAGVPMGQYRRTFQPFPNWTLICDENLAKKQRICNIAQTVQGPHHSTVFSWSLAAAQDGQPIFILRAPPALGERGTIQLTLPDGGPPVPVSVQGCNPTTCLAYQPVGPRLRAAVEKGAAVDISYASGSPAGTVSFRAPLAGLASALAAI